MTDSNGKIYVIFTNFQKYNLLVNVKKLQEYNYQYFDLDEIINTEFINFYEFYIKGNCTNYEKLRIEHLNNYKYKYDIINFSNKHTFLNNDLFSYMAYDIYLCINNLNTIQDNFNNSNLLYYVQFINNSSSNKQLLNFCNMDIKLANIYLSLLNNENLLKHEYILLKCKGINIYLFIILKKILKLNNIKYYIIDNMKNIDNMSNTNNIENINIYENVISI